MRARWRRDRADRCVQRARAHGLCLVVEEAVLVTTWRVERGDMFASGEVPARNGAMSAKRAAEAYAARVASEGVWPQQLGVIVGRAAVAS